MKLLDHVVVQFLVFWGNSIPFSIRTAPVYIPTNSSQGLSFHHILTLLTSGLLDNSHSAGMRWSVLELSSSAKLPWLSLSSKLIWNQLAGDMLSQKLPFSSENTDVSPSSFPLSVQRVGRKEQSRWIKINERLSDALQTARTRLLWVKTMESEELLPSSETI